MPAASAASTASTGMNSCTAADLAAVKRLVDSNATATTVCRSYDVASIGANAAVMQYTLAQLASTQSSLVRTQGELSDAVKGLDTSFLLASTYQVFMMQAGFALFAAGVIRSKNVFNILLKNVIDAAVAAVTFYLVGYGLAYGGGSHSNGFIGTDDFALSSTDDTANPNWQHFMWNWAFSAAAATIVSGAVAERVTFIAYLAYSFFISIFVYPVVVHWTWSPLGWLSARNTNDALLGIGAIDFAGCGVVHCVGGFASLVGAYLVGPRIGRFDPSISPSKFSASNAPQFVLGTFLLWFGWYGFNPGSVLRVSTAALASRVARVALVTTLGGGSGCVAAALLSFWRTRTWNLLAICTGLLAGLVSVTAACSVVEPWVGIFGGVVGAVLVEYASELMLLLRIDDPVAATPLHAACGLWGLLLVGLLGKAKYIREVYGSQISHQHEGILYGGNGRLLACQLLAMVVIPAWVIVNTGGLFLLLKRIGCLRVSAEEEVMGLDRVTNGELGGVNINDAKVGGMLNVRFANLGASFKSSYDGTEHRNANTPPTTTPPSNTPPGSSAPPHIAADQAAL